MKSVSILGLWHLGLVSAAVLADMGFKVTAFDANAQIMTGLRDGKLPIFEPGLDELVKVNAEEGRLGWAPSAEAAVAGAPVVLLTYDTPVDEEDRTDLTVLEQMLDAVLPHLASDALLIVNSQVPVGTCERWQERVLAARPNDRIDIACSPENLRLGQALDLFRTPDMIVVGASSDAGRAKAEAFFASFTSEKFFVSLRTAEMTKHALNVFFATCVSYANELGSLCDRVGADGIEISKILKKDARIGKKAQVRPGLGFAGATLARDLRALQDVGKKCHVATSMVDGALAVNERQIEQPVVMLDTWLSGVAGKTVAVLGLTYKPGTSTLRRSMSVDIIRKLAARGASVKAHDPKANFDELTGDMPFTFHADVYEACAASHAVLLMTEWPEYRTLDFERIAAGMREPRIVLDAKNHLDAAKLRALGLAYYEIGRGQLAAVAL